ncbi:hypothetical protein Ddye_025812 [Dipteronia dyeriana]|uniref:Uncharacterized protein n=1 Tax=Dipteronia dyeriana TaxID=168575 RepID=A0AAD9TKY9_9ROSI|nr:hypothetical protein Ddye_025812 [Dipteronia dyeriana]
MGCFFACFGACKRRKSQHLVNVTHFEGQRHEDLQVNESTQKEEPEQPISVSREKVDESVVCITKKKVSFDLNVNKTQQESQPIEEVTDNLLKDNENKEIEKEDEREIELKETKLVPNSITPNVVSHVLNNRYQNCVTSEDESEDLGLEESDLDDDDDSDGDNLVSCNEKILVQEESSESLFSLSIDSRKHVYEVELGEKEVNSPMPVRSLPIQEVREEVEENGLCRNARDRSRYVNLTRWKVVKARATTPPPSKYESKENINLMQDLDVPVCPVPTCKLSTHSSVSNSNNKKVLDQEVAVDTSLSSWLVESETTPMSKTSAVSVGNSPSQNASKPRSQEDESILAELKQLSTSSISPRRSRSQSPDEPIIGTVGSYWCCTGKIMDSDSSSSSHVMQKDRSENKEDERMKWDSIPFEARLESFEHMHC